MTASRKMEFGEVLSGKWVKNLIENRCHNTFGFQTPPIFPRPPNTLFEEVCLEIFRRTPLHHWKKKQWKFLPLPFRGDWWQPRDGTFTVTSKHKTSICIPFAFIVYAIHTLICIENSQPENKGEGKEQEEAAAERMCSKTLLNFFFGIFLRSLKFWNEYEFVLFTIWVMSAILWYSHTNPRVFKRKGCHFGSDAIFLLNFGRIKITQNFQFQNFLLISKLISKIFYSKLVFSFENSFIKIFLSPPFCSPFEGRSPASKVEQKYILA